jgi:hypothetical protein
MRLLQLDDLTTSYTNARPEAGLFVRLPRSSRLQLRCRGRIKGDSYKALFGRDGREVPLEDAASAASCNLDAHVVVDGVAQLLLTAEVLLRSLDRGVAQKKLNLVEFPSGNVAQTGARAS